MNAYTHEQYAAFVLRLALGTMFIAHALLKLVVFTPAGTASFFESLGLPGALAYMTMAAELGGGLLLVLGIATRWVSLALIPVLAGSVIFVHAASGWVFSNEGGGWEYPVFLIAASIAQSLLGDGAWAVRTPRLTNIGRRQAAVH